MGLEGLAWLNMHVYGWLLCGSLRRSPCGQSGLTQSSEVLREVAWGLASAREILGSQEAAH